MSQFRTIASLAALTTLVISFQNCAPTKFSSTSVASEKSFATSDGTGLPDADVPGDVAGDGSSTPAGSSVVVNPPPKCDDKKKDGDMPKAPSVSSDDAEARKVCGDYRKASDAAVLKDGVNVDHMSGNFKFQAASFGVVSNLSGSVVLVCNKTGGKIKEISDNSGKMLVCGCDVASISHRSGKIIVVDGNVGSIDHLSGIALVGGTIGSISDVSGKIASVK